ncbi:hypothetical protein QC761_510360 [Podospora bellae-mahoneyi]|uniref:Uncharacterized protein n=1 Tax=Podospora bellae-mahoneyi TaxID=2093777 RepID=A0ABR0FHA1_9PEZI|nr:hypothetical protein QC761_510360 [Podospora bellae-mahoneyi]
MFASNPNHTSYYGLRALDICLASSPNQGKISFKIFKRRAKEASTMWKPPGRTAAQKEVEHRGYEHQRFMLVQRLVQAGANLKASMISAHKIPPLVAAAAEETVLSSLPDIVDYLLDRGAPVDEPDAHGITALVATLGYGHCSCPFHIFPSGAKCPHNQPICRGLQKCVTLLLDSGAQISPVGSDSALLRLAMPSRYRRSAEFKGRVTQVGMKRDWYLAEEDKENLAHMFMSRHANPSLRSSSMRIPTISRIGKNMPYLTSDSTVVLNPLPQHYESWLLCKQSPSPPQHDRPRPGLGRPSSMRSGRETFLCSKS